MDTTQSEKPPEAQPGRIRKGGPVVSKAHQAPQISQGVPRAAGGGVLDVSGPSIEPFRTDDARTAVGALRLLGGYIMEDKETGDKYLLNEVVMREISGYEEDILASSKWDVTKKFNAILSNCLTRIGDGEGHYIHDRSQMPHIVDNLTQTDRIQMIFYLRMISVEPGPRFTFTANCPGCGEEFEKTVMLDQLKQVVPPDPMLRVYEVIAPGDLRVRCKILLGKDEAELGRAQEDTSNRASLAIKTRVISINNEVPRMPDIKKLTLRQRNYLRDQFEKHEGGIDTTVPGTCTACGRKFSMEVDISQRGFFFPSESPRS
jgi:hypothetical protein